MSYLFKKIIIKNLKYKLEHEYILNKIELNNICDEIEYCSKHEEDYLFNLLDEIEEKNIFINKILLDLYDR